MKAFYYCYVDCVELVQIDECDELARVGECGAVEVRPVCRWC